MVMVMLGTWLTSTLWSSACFVGTECLQPCRTTSFLELLSFAAAALVTSVLTLRNCQQLVLRVNSVDNACLHHKPVPSGAWHPMIDRPHQKRRPSLGIRSCK